MKKWLLVLVPALLAGCGGSNTATVASALAKQVIASGLNQPMQYKAVPGQPTLAYVVERGGVIKVLVNDALQSTPLIEVSGSMSTSGEGGLLGIAFDPSFASNRYLYLHYSTGADVDTTIVRYTVDSTYLTSSTGSAQPILKVSQAPYTNHKGGSINFGGDNMLYVALGDGGSGNDPLNRSQDKTTLLGKMLRIDPSSDDYPTDPDNNYSIPAGNPFLTDSTVRPEIWAFGLRNPFRWTYAAGLNGFFIADVGQDSYEEINFVSLFNGGRNFGWRVREGLHSTTNTGPAFGTVFHSPWVEYGRADGRSVTGGFVYGNTTLPGVTGHYFFADFVSNKLWAVRFGIGSEIENISAGNPREVSGGLNGVVSIDPDASGEVVLTELGAGTVSRLIPAPPAVP